MDEKMDVLRYKVEAEEGNVSAMHILGSCYLEGKNIEKDIPEGLYWLGEAELEQADCKIARFYLNEGDLERAENWYMKAIQHIGSYGIDTYTDIIMFYMKSKKKNLDIAKKYIEDAWEIAESKRENLCDLLVEITKELTDKNAAYSLLSKAMEYIENKAEQGDKETALMVLSYYDSYEKNFEKTIYWANKSAQLGLQQGYEVLDREEKKYEKHLTSDIAKGLMNELKKVKGTVLYIPDTYTHIDDFAFCNTPYLEQIEKVCFPESVTYIGKGAFEGCSKLTEIQLPAKLRFLGGSAFNGERQKLFRGVVPDQRIIERLVIPTLTLMQEGIDKFDYSLYGIKRINELIIEDGRKVMECNFLYGNSIGTLYLPDSLEDLKYINGLSNAIIDKVSMPSRCKYEDMEILFNTMRIADIEYR